jgi:UDP-N-acetylmuramate dehydrogenase
MLRFVYKFALLQRYIMKIEENITIGNLTSYKIGGVAKKYVEVCDESDIVGALEYAKEHEIAFFILGKGSNILVSDHGFDGLVIDMKSYNKVSINSNTLTVCGGALLTKVVVSTINCGLSGMEKLAGIPGTIGGGVVMNAGAYGQTISDNLISVTSIDCETLKIINRSKDELAFGYRTSLFKEVREVVLSAKFQLSNGDTALLKEEIAIIQKMRRDKQPLESPSCGSVFKRPEGNYAGALIEQAGLKGRKFGGVEVSAKHSNFIINSRGGRAEHVRRAISSIRKEVYEKSGILLVPEVIFVGKFSSSIWFPDK